MPASAWGGLYIPCLMRVPASETTATQMERMSALFQRKDCHRCLPSSWGRWEGGEPGGTRCTRGLGSLPWSLKRHSLSSYVNIPSSVSGAISSSTALGKSLQCGLEGFHLLRPEFQPEPVLCSKMLGLLVGTISPQMPLLD